MEVAPNHTEIDLDRASAESKSPGALSIVRRLWVWATGLMIIAACVFRLTRLAYPDPYACAEPPPSASPDSMVLMCSFSGPIMPLDSYMFGVLYMWLLASLVTALIGMRWRGAGLVLLMTLALIVADLSSKEIYDYFR